MRTLFNSPIEGTTEVVAAYYMVIDRVSALGLGRAQRQPHRRRHLQADRHAGFDYWVEIGVKLLTIAYCRGLRLSDLSSRRSQRTGAGRGLARRHEVSPGLAGALAAAARRRADDRASPAARDRRHRARPAQPGKDAA